MTEKDLLDLKTTIEETKTQVSELKGQRKELMRQLKETYDCETVEAAEKKLLKMEKKVEQMAEQITTATQELEEKYFPEEQ